MELTTLKNNLSKLYEELAKVKEMTNKQVCRAYQVNYKREAIASIWDKISDIEDEIEEIESLDYLDEEIEEERTNLCLSQGISRYC